MKVGDGSGNHVHAPGRYRRDDVYGDFHVRLPVPIHNALKRVIEDKGISNTSVFYALVEKYLEDNMCPEDYRSLMDFVDKYYPPYKSQEVVAFWEKHLGLDEEK